MTTSLRRSQQLQDLVRFVQTYPLTDEVRRTLTFGQFSEQLHAKAADLGVDLQCLEESVDEHTAQLWRHVVGAALEERGLQAKPQHADLPLDFQLMPEYEAVRQAEAQFWERHCHGEPVDQGDLAAVIRQHMPPNR